MTSQIKGKLTKLILDETTTNYFRNIFDYGDILVARERSNISEDLGKVTSKYHYGSTPKKNQKIAI